MSEYSTHSRVPQQSPPPEGQKMARLTNVPKPGEQVHVLEVPSSFQDRPPREIHTMLRVEMHGSTATLVEK
jgi:hypothetical protein